MDIQIRSATADEIPQLFQSFMRTMGFDPLPQVALDAAAQRMDLERTVCAFDGDRMVGTAYSHVFEFTLPGGALVPAAGVTVVSVVPTHRRRGILRRIMERQLTDVRARGETVAILLASEAVIYGRFGYGPCSFLHDYEIETLRAAYAEPSTDPGRLRFVDEQEADKLFPELYDAWRRRQPGTTDRPEWMWSDQRRDRKAGEESMVVHEDADGRPDGYVRYAVKQKWSGGLARGRAEVRDLVWLSSDAYAALWRHCLDLDLVERLAIGGRPVDERLRWMLANPRALQITRSGDLLWLRPLDVERLLGSRTYRTPVDLVLEVEDALLPDSGGRFRLRGGPDGATCERVSEDADLTLSARDLGTICLGALGAGELAVVGRVREHTAGALATADAAFSSVPKPWTPTWF